MALKWLEPAPNLPIMPGSRNWKGAHFTDQSIHQKRMFKITNHENWNYLLAISPLNFWLVDQSANRPLLKLSSLRLDWPRLGLYANCPITPTSCSWGGSQYLNWHRQNKTKENTETFQTHTAQGITICFPDTPQKQVARTKRYITNTAFISKA